MNGLPFDIQNLIMKYKKSFELIDEEPSPMDFGIRELSCAMLPWLSALDMPLWRSPRMNELFNYNPMIHVYFAEIEENWKERHTIWKIPCDTPPECMKHNTGFIIYKIIQSCKLNINDT